MYNCDEEPIISKSFALEPINAAFRFSGFSYSRAKYDHPLRRTRKPEGGSDSPKTPARAPDWSPQRH